MAGTATAHKHTDLELALIRLSDTQARTEDNLDRYAAEMRQRQAQTGAHLDRYIAENDRRFAELAVEVKKANRAAGEAAGRAGRLVEDIVAPSIHDFFCSTFNWQGPVESAIRLSRTSRSKPGETHEFDAFVAGGDTFLVVSVKSKVSADFVNELLGDLSVIRDFFPEAEKRRAYGVMASLYIDPTVLTMGERRGLFMVGLQSGLVTSLNSPGFKPTEF